MRRFAALVPFAFAATLAAPAYAGSISIEGRGEVTASPDMAHISSGVTSQGATAREALDSNSAAMTELLDALKAAGIEARDIQTSNFTVTPNYVYSDARDESGYSLPPKIDGYQVSNTVTVIVRELDELGAILDQSVTVGANTINGITFAVADPSALYDEARKAAFADAREKAELYATAAGGTLSEIESISESQGFNSPQPVAMYAVRAEAAAADVPVEGGELTFSINVNVQWELETSAN